MSQENNKNEIISLAEASKLTGYNQDYLGQLCRSGKLTAQKYGRNWTTTRGAVEELMRTASEDSETSSLKEVQTVIGNQIPSRHPIPTPRAHAVIGVPIAIKQRMLSEGSLSIQQVRDRVERLKTESRLQRLERSTLGISELKTKPKNKAAVIAIMTIFLVGGLAYQYGHTLLQKFFGASSAEVVVVDHSKRTIAKNPNAREQVLGTLLRLPVTRQTNGSLVASLDEDDLHKLILFNLEGAINAGWIARGGEQSAPTQPIASPVGSSQPAAPIYYYVPAPDSDAQGGSIIAATSISSQEFETDTARVNDSLTVSGTTVLSGDVIITGACSGCGDPLAIGGAIGSATAGSLLFADSSGNLAQDNNNLFYDDTANALGIGTNSIVASSILQLNSTTKGFLPPRMTSVERDAIASPALGLIVYNTTTDALNIYTGSWNPVASVIDIGTTLASGTQGSVLFLGSSGALAQDNTNFFWDDSTNRLGLGTSSPTNLLTLNSDANTEIFADSSHPFNIEAGNNLILQADGSYLTLSAAGQVVVTGGNFGVNELTPASQLAVNGSLAVGTSTSYSQAAAPTGGAIIQGNVGIGTTSPAGSLHIGTAATRQLLLNRTEIGTTLTDGTYLGVGGSGEFSIINQEAGPLIFGTSGSEVARFNSTGSLGIGTTSPSEKLHVAPASGNGYLRVESIAGAETGINFYKGGAPKAYIYVGAGSNDLRIQDSTADRITLQNGGNVGIGTTNPDALLSVYGAGSALSGTSRYVMGVGSANGVKGLYFGYDTSANIAVIDAFNSSSQLAFWGDNGGGQVERARFNANGYLGINTTNPTAMLQVNTLGDTVAGIKVRGQNGGQTENLQEWGWPSSPTESYVNGVGAFIVRALTSNGVITAGGSGGLQLGNSSQGSGTGIFGDNSGAYLSLFTSGSEKVRILNSGNFGIGTTNPQFKLHVVGTSNFTGQSYFGDQLTGHYLTIVKVPSPGSYFTGSVATDIWLGSPDGTIALGNDTTGTANLIVKGGSVGIGTTAPATILDVNGVTTFRGNIIAGTDNTYDIGASGATRPRTGYFGTSVVTPTLSASTSLTTPALYISGTTSSDYLLRKGSVTNLLVRAGDDSGFSNLGMGGFATSSDARFGGLQSDGSLGTTVIMARANNAAQGVLAVYGSGGHPQIALTGTANAENGWDVFLTRASAANLQLGDVAAASPTAQTLSVQNVASGTSNTAGANFTIAGSQGTGTGAGGAILFQTAPAGLAGSSVNSLATAMTILGSGNVGIGTTNPGSLLTVNSASGAAQVDINHFNSATGATLSLRDTNSDRFLTLNHANTSVGVLRVGTDGNSTTPAFSINVTNYNNTSAVGTRDLFSIQNGGSSKFYINNAGNVGIGTTNPTVALTVYGSTQAAQTIKIGSSSTVDYSIYRDNTNGPLTFDGTQTGFIGYRFNSGNIGVGIAPDLTTSGRLAANNAVTIGTTGNAASNNGNFLTILSSTTNTSTVRLETGSGRPWEIFTTGSDGKLQVKDITAGLTRLAIDTSGLVGIGTTTPANRLEVQSTTSPQLRVAYDASNYFTSAVSSSGAVTFDATGGSAGFIFSDYISRPGSGSATELFGSGAVGTGDNNVVVGNSASAGSANPNNVVIGASATATANQGNVVVGKSAVGGGGFDVVLGYLAAINSSGSVGNVLIGKSAQISSTGTPTGNVFIGQAVTGGTNPQNSIAIGNTIDNSSGSYNVLLNGSVDVASLSNVFIAGNNTGPINNLYFGKGKTNAAPTAYTINGTGGTGSNIIGGDLQLAGGIATGNAVGGGILFKTSDAGSSGSSAQSLTTKMTILASGNVGIGTTNPGYRLQVTADNNGAGLGLYVNRTGAPNSTPGVLIEDSNTSSVAAIGFRLNGVGGTNYIAGNEGGTFKISPGSSFSSTAFLAVNSSGNVGIGTSSPGASLHVVADNATTNDITDMEILQHTTTGTAAAGIGTAMLFRTENGSGTLKDVARIQSTLSVVTAGSETGVLEMKLLVVPIFGANVGTVFKIDGNTGGTAVGIGASAAGTSSSAVGRQASAAGTSAVAMSYNSSAAGAYAIAIGQTSSVHSSTGSGIALGLSAAVGSSSDDSIAIGQSATVSNSNSSSIAIGSFTTTTASNQLVIGGGSGRNISTAYIGNGVTAASPSAFTLNATGGSGSNVVGANLQIAGGKGTGNAAGGDILFQTSDAGASGATLQSLTTKLAIKASGNVGVGTTTPGAKLEVAPAAVSSGAQVYLKVTTAADTGLTASTESIAIDFNTAATRQFAAGALANQREVVFRAPTYAFASASTITMASTVSITGPPVAGTNATITKGAALQIENGNIYLGNTSANQSAGILANGQAGWPDQIIMNLGSVDVNLYNQTNAYRLASDGLHIAPSIGILSSASGTPFAQDVGFQRDGAAGWQINNATAGQWGYLKVGTRDAGTNTVTNGLTIGHQSTGTPAAGLGSAILFNINSSTTADQNAGRIVALWTDATHASRTSALTFSTVNNAAALAEVMRIQGDGNVGIGTTTPGAKLDVRGDVQIGTSGSSQSLTLYQSGSSNGLVLKDVADGDADVVTLTQQADNGKILLNGGGTTKVELYGGGDSYFNGGELGIGTTTPNFQLEVVRGTAGVVARFTDSDGSCDIDPTSTALVCASDQNLKKDISTLQGTLAKLQNFRGVNFRWKTQDDSALRIGFIAQEVESVFPELVKTDIITGIKSVNYLGFAPVLVNAIKEQQTEIETIQNQLSALQGSDAISGNTPIVIKSHLYLSKDSVGQAKILAGATSVRVSFEKPYEYQPIVTATPNSRVGGEYWVADKDASGFTIYIENSFVADIIFDWHAFAGEDAKLFVSNGAQEDIVLITPKIAEPPAEETISVEPAPDEQASVGEEQTEPVSQNEVPNTQNTAQDESVTDTSSGQSPQPSTSDQDSSEGQETSVDLH